jgi:hypothetical protein
MTTFGGPASAPQPRGNHAGTTVSSIVFNANIRIGLPAGLAPQSMPWPRRGRGARRRRRDAGRYRSRHVEGGGTRRRRRGAAGINPPCRGPRRRPRRSPAARHRAVGLPVSIRYVEAVALTGRPDAGRDQSAMSKAVALAGGRPDAGRNRSVEAHVEALPLAAARHRAGGLAAFDPAMSSSPVAASAFVKGPTIGNHAPDAADARGVQVQDAANR